MSLLAKRRELEVLEALEPIRVENVEAKAAYQAAVESGDERAIAKAKARKDQAARRLNETRRWLRTEARVAELASELEQLEQRGDQVAAQTVRAQLQRWEEQARPYREALAALAGGAGKKGSR